MFTDCVGSDIFDVVASILGFFYFILGIDIILRINPSKLLKSQFEDLTCGKKKNTKKKTQNNCH